MIRHLNLSELRGVEPGADAGAVKEDAHAEGFTALRSDEAQLAAHMIGVLDEDETGFVGGSALFEPGNSFLDGAAKARADLEAVLRCEALNHGVVPDSCGRWLEEGELSLLSPMVAGRGCPRQITGSLGSDETEVMLCIEMRQSRNRQLAVFCSLLPIAC